MPKTQDKGLLKGKGDKEGRYCIQCDYQKEGKITFAEIYAPPEGDRKFFKFLFDPVVSESNKVFDRGD